MDDDTYLAIVSAIEAGQLDIGDAADLLLSQERAEIWYRKNWNYDPY